jgi:hypothetical protein
LQAQIRVDDERRAKARDAYSTVTDLRELSFATDERRKAEQGWDLDIGSASCWSV